MQRVWEGHDVSHGQVQTAAGLPVREQTFHWPAPQSRYRTDKLAQGEDRSIPTLREDRSIPTLWCALCTAGKDEGKVVMRFLLFFSSSN